MVNLEFAPFKKVGRARSRDRVDVRADDSRQSSTQEMHRGAKTQTPPGFNSEKQPDGL